MEFRVKYRVRRTEERVRKLTIDRSTEREEIDSTGGEYDGSNEI